MQGRKWNQNWTFQKNGAEPVPVTLPHDAMLTEKRDPDCRNGKQTGFYPGGKYTYTKRFRYSAGKAPSFCGVEFEAVYCRSRVYLNDVPVGEWPYGYTGFLADLKDHLVDGENELRVEVDNSGEPGSRWYSGAGIFRDVWLWESEKDGCILPHGIKVQTLSATDREARIRVQVNARYPKEEGWEILLDVRKNGETVVRGSGSDVVLSVRDPLLWSDESPELYEIRCTLMQDGEVIDTAAETFGIRTLEWEAGKGLLVNGREVLLRGGLHSSRQRDSRRLRVQGRRREENPDLKGKRL